MHKPVKKKWRLLFGLNCVAALCLFIILHVAPLKYFLIAPRQLLSQWYPHVGFALFYLLKIVFLLQVGLCAIALGGLLYLLITRLTGAIKRWMARLGGRTLQFKLISAALALAALVVLVKLGVDFFKMPGAYDYDLNYAINKRNAAYASGNLFGFTDRNHTPAKPKGVFRIAVLGDSFVWGDGLPYQQAWSHRLERMLCAKYDSVEVLHWGYCGWSTLDEFNFYRQHGKDYDVDLLIIGWVDNDPDMGAWPLVVATDPATKYPLVFKILPSLARRWTNAQEQHDYKIYFDTMYSHENLDRYGSLLDTFNTFLKERHTQSLVVMTPRPLPNQMKERMDAVEPLIRKAGFSCLNLYLPMQKKLGGYTALQLQANPVNGHPGVLMTQEYANEVMQYLETNNYLSKLPIIK